MRATIHWALHFVHADEEMEGACVPGVIYCICARNFYRDEDEDTKQLKRPDRSTTRELVGRRAPYVTTDRMLMSGTVCLLGEVLSGIQRPRCPGH